jgi:hypothetical protein
MRIKPSREVNVVQACEHELIRAGQFDIRNIGLDRVRIVFRRQAHCLRPDSEHHLGAVRHGAFHVRSPHSIVCCCPAVLRSAP